MHQSEFPVQTFLYSHTVSDNNAGLSCRCRLVALINISLVMSLDTGPIYS